MQNETEPVDQDPADTLEVGQAAPSLLLIAAAAIVAGVLAGLAAVNLGSSFDYPAELSTALANPNAEVDAQEVRQWDRQLLYRNTTLSAVVSSVIIAGLLGLASGIGSSQPSALGRLGLGILAGAAFGAVGGVAGSATWQYLVENEILLENPDDTTIQAAIANSVVWALIGASAGLAIGFKRTLANSLVAGVAGGVLGAWLCLLITAFFLSSARTNLPIPQEMFETPWVAARFIWACLPAVVMGLLLAGSVTTPPAATSEEQEDS